ncbi:23S rRNA pseudouridine1911/1915/1917 synthase [Enterococcus sp. PF1-24]|uniref:RluA family pseudouridine synthase n=1 Tax=unclassified Enterococcus TaxID=2608891 RepID=UPI002473C860|nr:MULTISPECIES: RluA family pseudouridine synthase [unclassified Enterococcus]MDH6363512.1 23S rRNA pseudouridine1911/1915/1917 synthase [Enterococcus sp. PFB1-1]MDH6400606.1 23S rRNA pseudouridine1911/1915/1917 synthase [Enterococcus sp. PF1-24]
MEFQITLPPQQEEISLRELLENEWLIPRKVRHFLRVRKNVLLAGEAITFSDKVHANDTLTVILDDADYQHQEVLLGKANLVEVLYEDEHLIIVNKTAGMKTHPNAPDEQNTLQNHLAAYLEPQQQRPFVVHRLDKETSGAIVFAKNPLILPVLGRLLESKEIKRVYQAIVRGKLTKDQTITSKIGRHRHDRRKRVIDEVNGQTATTHITVVKAGKNSQILCQLETGRTHQIRVHLASLGHGIIGDPLYNPNSNSPRLQLHAYELGMIHPFTKEEIHVLAEPGLWE